MQPSQTYIWYRTTKLKPKITPDLSHEFKLTFLYATINVKHLLDNTLPPNHLVLSFWANVSKPPEGFTRT